MTERKRVRPMVAITIDPDVLEFLTKEAERLKMSRSRLIENCLMLSVNDYKILKKVGLIDAAGVLKSFQAKLNSEIFAGAH